MTRLTRPDSLLTSFSKSRKTFAYRRFSLNFHEYENNFTTSCPKPPKHMNLTTSSTISLTLIQRKSMIIFFTFTHYWLLICRGVKGANHLQCNLENACSIQNILAKSKINIYRTMLILFSEPV